MKQKMNIAGLTWWRNNYGSILQAYALQQELNSLPSVNYEIINQYGKKIASADNLADKLRTIGVLATLKRIIWKFCIPMMRQRNQKIQHFVDSKLKVSEQQYTEETIITANDMYDAFICGSDQIWNPTLSGLDTMYWLGFANEKIIKIAYAPSIGITSVTDEQAEQIRCNLSSFHAVSCREKSGAELIDHILGEEASCKNVLDPTLMVNGECWGKICPSRSVKEPYIFVYLLRGTKHQRKMIEQFAKDKQLKIVTIPFLETDHTVWYDMKFGDIRLWDAAPGDFISAIRYAEYVFTDSFHSTVFSCLYHKQFFNIPKIGKSQAARVTSLLELLGIESRNVECYEDISMVEQKSIDWENADSILEKKREFSQDYIRSALSL